MGLVGKGFRCLVPWRALGPSRIVGVDDARTEARQGGWRHDGSDDSRAYISRGARGDAADWTVHINFKTDFPGHVSQTQK